MITRVAPSNWRLHIAMAALLAAAIALQVVRDRGWQAYEPPNGVMWIRSGALAQRLALGFDNIAADIYWMRAVVYFGGKRLATVNKNYEQLFPLLDLVTSLDPKFNVAYRFGAIFLAEEYPGGAGRPDLAEQLLEKGFRLNPTRWEYLEDIGFLYYWWGSDYGKAADFFRRASEVPGAPSWMAPLAATTLAEGGSRQSSRQLWQRLHDSTEIDWVRSNAEHRLQQLDAMDQIDQLQPIVNEFVARHGRLPRGLEEIAAERRWRQLPMDPTGMPYDLDRKTGLVTITRSSMLWPLPTGQSTRTRQ